MHTQRSLVGLACRVAALSFLVAGTASRIEAQQTPATASNQSEPVLMAAAAAPANLAANSGTVYSSSVSPDVADGQHFDLSAAALASSQPPPRRRYGRPNYADSHTNPDGSNKFAFEGGFGLTLPTGGTHNYLTPGYRFQVGGGRNFNKTFGVLAQFDYDHFGFQTATLNKLLGIYNAEIAAYNATVSTQNQVSPLTQLGGTSHDWSFTLDPIINYYNGEKWGAYVVGGAGFYHKTANFTIPATGEECDPYYGCFTYQANQSIDKYTSNAFGANGGFGFTLKPSRFASERFFAEARYVWTDNQPKPYSETGTTANPNYFNVFPQNSARTTYVPITFGLRF